MLPITSFSPSSEIQIGIAVAQYLFLEMFQSGAVSIVYLTLPSFRNLGYQFIFLLNSRSFGVIFFISTKHASKRM